MSNYRSGLEERFSKHLDKHGVPFLYEVEKFAYVTQSTYCPDFFLPNGVIIECKGFYRPSDRRKMLAVKQQHPELDIRLVFQRNNTISKNSKTTYGDWADKYNFPWCVFPDVPSHWFE